MISISQRTGFTKLLQRTGTIKVTQRKGLVTFTIGKEEAITPPVFSLDFSKELNSQYINIIL